MSGVETDECCRALGAHEKKYKRGDIIMHAGATAENMGVVISGSVTIESVDVWGNCTILSHVGEKGFFAENAPYYAVMQFDATKSIPFDQPINLHKRNYTTVAQIYPLSDFIEIK